tara:strand:- start:474 stop:941 length:468 start_codon:yes stop_codon:yes gene_type:complete
MGITTAMCNSFKQELLGGVHDLDTHTLKLALIKASPTENYGKNTTTYDGSSGGDGTSLTQGTNDEASGTNYSTGGITLQNPVIGLDSDTATLDFTTNPQLSSATISADGCLIYNSSASNKAIAVIDFSGTKTSTNGDFVITMPTANASSAIVRIA